MSEGSTIPAQELLRGIGPRLKAAREAKDLTLQEISSRTRINITFLANIESAQTENLPGLTFVRGFIRSYLQALDLRDEEIESALSQISELEQYKSETELGPRINKLEMNDDEAGKTMRKNLILGAVLLAVLGVIYLGTRLIIGLGDDTPQTAGTSQRAAEQPAESPSPLAEKASPPPAANPAQPPASKANVSRTQVRPASSPQNLRLTVRGLEHTWIRLAIDRAPPVDVRLSPAETMNWEANEEFRLIIGKSHGVAVYLNGEDILLPEGRNQLIPDVLLNKLTLLRLEN